MERENRSNDVHDHAARQLEDVGVDGQRPKCIQKAGGAVKNTRCVRAGCEKLVPESMVPLESEMDAAN